jgi:hypothetical protein
MMVTVADVPSGNSLIVKNELEQEGKAALQTLIELSQNAGGDPTGADKSRPYSTTRYVRAMDALADLASERPEMRPRILPSILQMHKDAPAETRLYTMSRLKLQRLVWESSDAQANENRDWGRRGY